MLDEQNYRKERMFCWVPRVVEDGSFAWFRPATRIAYAKGVCKGREIAFYKSEEGLLADILSGEYSEYKAFPE